MPLSFDDPEQNLMVITSCFVHIFFGISLGSFLLIREKEKNGTWRFHFLQFVLGGVIPFTITITVTLLISFGTIRYTNINSGLIEQFMLIFLGFYLMVCMKKD